MDWADRYLQQGVFAEQGSQINLRTFRQDQTRLANRFIVERVQLRELPFEMMRKILQAAHTLKCCITGKIPLHYKPLLRATYLYRAQHVSQSEIFNFNLGDVKSELTGKANFLMNNKTDINTERFTGIC